MSQGEFTKIADVSQVPEGGLHLATLGNARIALANVGGTIYAFDDECTHDGGPLSDGDLHADCSVTCPWHFSRFDIRTGEILDSPAEEPIGVYEVKVEGTEVFVGSRSEPS
jgi:3-phenylpropionate/trans-cinnamate dioxygenase ferredoxin subunit